MPLRRAHGLHLAHLLVMRGDYRGAEEELRRYLGQGPQIGASRLLVHALCGLDRDSDALPIARTVLERDPRQEDHALVAWVLIAGELDLDEGIALAEKAMKLESPPFP